MSIKEYTQEYLFQGIHKCQIWEQPKCLLIVEYISKL